MSYDIAEYKWGEGTLGAPSGTIFWDADLSEGLAYNESLFDAEDFDAALVAAFDAWEAVADIDFEEASVPGDADITVDMATLSGSTVGQALIGYAIVPGIDRILYGEITMDQTEVWAPYGGGGTDFYAVALHEIGHVLGLNHVIDTSEIMNPVVNADDLGDGDIAGARVLYGNSGAGAGAMAPPAGDAPVDEVEAPPTPDPTATEGDDGGGGGGMIGLLLGGLLAALAALFGVGGGVGAVALAQREDEDGDGTDLISDDLPVTDWSSYEIAEQVICDGNCQNPDHFHDHGPYHHDAALA